MKARIDGFENVDRILSRLMEPEKITKKAVEAATPALVESTQKSIKSAANKGYATGKLAASVAATKPKRNKYGTYSIVRPVGYDKDGNSYYARGAYLEYGTKKNAPQPWRQKAVNDAESKCEELMEQAVADEVKKIEGGGL
jgi:HK97 gp10 family phage protein